MADDFQFMKETRKEKPINRKRLFRHMVETVVLAVLFGAVASLTFVVLKPRLEQYFSPEEQQQVSFVEPEAEEKPVQEKENEEEKSEPETVIIEKATPLDLSQYQTLQNKLYAVGREADKFIVSVTNVKNDTDMFNTTYETKGIGSGVIIADTGDQMLILTEKKTIAGASSIRVTFVDGVTVKAELQQYDGNTGIAVLRVKAEDVSKDTKRQIAVATLGSSVGVSQGQTVLAVGSPIGTIHSILTGNITSNRNTVSTMDCNYTIFTTDMVGSADASGALINTKGEIIGFVLQDYNMQKEQTTLAAVSISELKGVIELLSNDKPVPYLGLRISTVTDDIAENYQMPKGVYVRDVALDSPAMEAGFQSGDVITAINGEPVLVAEDYEKMLRELTVEEMVHITYERQGAEEYIPLEIEAKVGVLE
ncbi:MAG: PDZ domain-containing protein [Lachnospiraceae bacterium]|nr:PDZ domain-containing protein [bacterium]MDY5516329.1 PDZ domain-containing protein [Lachnospiraceae bacterium]